MDISPCPLSPPFFSEILTPLIAPIRATFSGGYTHEIPGDGCPTNKSNFGVQVSWADPLSYGR